MRGQWALKPHSAHLGETCLSFPTCDVGKPRQRRPYCNENILEVTIPERHQEAARRGWGDPGEFRWQFLHPPTWGRV